jgi:restriction system protein
MRPILVARGDGEPRPVQAIRSLVAEALNVSEDDQEELLGSGKQTRYSNRIGWPLTHMAKAGLVERPARAQYAISMRGKQVLADNPDRVDTAVLLAFPEYQNFRMPEVAPGDEGSAEAAATAVASAEVSPSEAMEALLKGADRAVAGELLERILAQPPAFLERLALRLLAAMGYGGRESLTEHTGKSGDAGLDGLVRQDALGLELIGVQAKRYDREACVNRPAIQAFVGALQGAQASRGVFITTGRFSAGARQFAEAVPMRMVLLDGEQLTRAMVRYNVGVALRETFELKQVDEDFFEE